MNPAPTVPVSWSWQRWCSLVALIWIAQIALLFLFSERTPISMAPPPEGAGVTLILDAEVNRQVFETLGASDPTLFALISPGSFSGKGWLNVPPRRHRLQDWTEPDFALAPNAPVVGGMFASFLRTNLAVLEMGGGKLSPEIRSLARPLLSLPLLTTNLGPPEVARPQVARVRSVPVWSNPDSREPLAWLRPQFPVLGDAWRSMVVTNPVPASPPSRVSPFPAKIPAPIPVPSGATPGPASTNAPRSSPGSPAGPRSPAAPSGL